MLSMLVNHVIAALRNEEGIETLEWVLIGALITAIAVIVYPSTLQPALLTAVGYITTALEGSGG